MSTEELNEKIFAAALGCLDNNEVNLFNKTIIGNKDFQEKNLGIYQQLVSMLPLVLEPAEADKGVKDKIARKVYRLKDTGASSILDSISKPVYSNTKDTTEKISPAKEETQENPVPPEITKSPKTTDIIIDQTPVNVPVPAANEKPKQITERFEKINSLADDNVKGDIVFTQRKLDIPLGETKRKPSRKEIEPKEDEETFPVELPVIEEDVEKKSKFFTMLLIFISAITMIGSAIIYIKYSSENDRLGLQIDELRTQIDNLKNESEANAKLLALIESGDLKIIPLNPLRGDTTALVRILIDEKTFSGFLQTNFIITGTAGISLMLWGISQETKLILAELSDKKENCFYPLTITPPSSSGEIIFVISKPSSSDSTATVDSLLFSGSYFYSAPVQ